jgi:hypothetical protein
MMKRKVIVVLSVTAVLSLLIAIGVAAAGQSELAQVRAATAQFHQPEAAQAAGWDLVPGLDHCFENPGVGAMGFHYINVDLLDLTLDPRQPEAMVYAPGQNGKLHLAAVEWIVEDWNPNVSCPAE